MSIEELLIYIVPVVALVVVVAALTMTKRRPRQYSPPPTPLPESQPVPTEETIVGSGVVETPNPMKPSITYNVLVHVIGEELPKGVEIKEELFKETIALEMTARGPLITIFSHSDAFNVSPMERRVPVPRKGEKSTTIFYVSPILSYTGRQKLFFEFHQGDRFLGLANLDLEISTVTEPERKLVVALSFNMRIHV